MVPVTVIIMTVSSRTNVIWGYVHESLADNAEFRISSC